MADEIKMTRSQGPSRPSSRYWTAAVGIRSSTASTVPRTIAISALVAWSPTWATLGCVGGSWVDASVVQVVRWQGAGALAGWAPSERRQRRPTCRLGGGGARLGFTDVPWTGRLPDRERSGRGDGHRGRLVVELRHDVRRVLADPTDGVRVEHVLEVLAQHVEAGLPLDGTALAGQPPGRVQSGQVDPSEPVLEAGAPDHVGDGEHLAVLVLWPTVDDRTDPGRPLDARLLDVLLLLPDPRVALALEQPRLDLAARLRPLGEDVLPHPPHHREQHPALPAPRVEGDLSDHPSSQQHAVGRRAVHRDLGAGVPRADQQHRARRELAGVAVVRRVQLHDVVG